MLKALRALPGEQRRIDLKPWLYRVAHNEAISMLRELRRHEPLDLAAPSQAPGPQQALEERERIRTLLADLTRLSDQQRGALLMKEVGDLDYAQIGAALEISPGAARVAVHKARLALVQQSEGRDMACDAVRQKISAADGRVLAARRMRSHLRACTACREFRDSISVHSTQLQAVAPFAAAPVALRILDSVLPAGGEATGNGGLAALLTGGGGKLAGGSVAAKAMAVGVATVAVGGAVAGLDGKLPSAFGGESTPSRSQGAGSPAPGQHEPGQTSNTSNSGNEHAAEAGKPQGGGSGAGGQHGEAGNGAVNGGGAQADTGPAPGAGGGSEGSPAPDTAGPPVTPGPPSGGPSSDAGMGAANQVVPGGLPDAADAGAGHGPPASPGPPVEPPVPPSPQPPSGVPGPPGS
jgi:RNA polymerase sigma factor (sigma-70 family)